MGYHHLDPAAIEPTPDRPSVQRAIDDAAGLANLAVKRYEVAPGEDVPLAYHYHDDQEEVFYVLAGRLHVETPDREYAVGADEVFVVEPDSPQRAYNPGSANGEVVVLAVAAPQVDDVHPYEP
ncbi:MAG: cupin domain-containing protein [Haloglomus sp.]